MCARLKHVFSSTDVPASGMYFLTYEYIKKKVVDSAPKDKPVTKTREVSGTIFAGGMGRSPRTGGGSGIY